MSTRARAAAVGVAVLVAAAGSGAAAPQEVALTDAGFERPVIQVFNRVVQAGGDLGGWTVDSGSVDLLRSPSRAWVHSGAQAVDLTGISAGVISQSFDTVPGHVYDVEYAVGSNRDGIRNGSAPQSGDDWRVEVTGGTAPAARTGHWTGTGAGDAASGPADAVESDGLWERWSLRGITAAGTSMTVRFVSLEPGFYGVLLDDVSVSTENRPPVVEDGSLTTAEDTPSAPFAPPTSDPDGDVVTYTASDPAHGTVTVAPDGTSLVYEPDVEHTGTDSFLVTGDDGHGGSDSGLVTVTVTPVRSPSAITNTRPSQGYGTNAKQTVVMHAAVTSTDAACVADRVVTFTVTPTTAGADPVTVLTDAEGLASARFTLPEGEYAVTSALERTPSCRSGSDTDPYSAVRRVR